MAQGGSNKKVANSLVAISAAAVLAVYAAGYERTRSAADKLDAQSAGRRPAIPRGSEAAGTVPAVAPPVAPGEKEPAAADPKAVASLERPAATEPSQGTISVAQSTASPTLKQIPEASGEPKSQVLKPVTPVAAVATPVTTPAVTTAAASSPMADTSSAAPVIAPVPVAAPPPTVSILAPPPPTQSPASPAVAPAPKWKDGTYTGWGTCRHGDIQAAVVIEQVGLSPPL